MTNGVPGSAGQGGAAKVRRGAAKVRLGLKVDVDTLRGTREGVPGLLRLFDRHGLRASFFFSLGPDHTGRALRRVLRPGFLDKVARTSVLSHYGLKTLLYGTVLPGPDIGRRAAAMMRAVREAGHEVGVHAFDHVRWQDGVARAGAAWTAREFSRALGRFREIFGEPARAHAAAGWQMNAHAFALEDGLDYASDTRGHAPFLPVVGGRRLGCAQLPTTLPTLDEVLGRDRRTAATAAVDLLTLSARPPPAGHVFTLHAELEGLRLLPVLDTLLAGWRSQGYAPCALADLLADLDLARLPRHEIIYRPVPGRAGRLAAQGPASHRRGGPASG